MNNMSNLFLLSNAVSRSISPENLNGAKGAGAMCELEDGSAKYAARDPVSYTHLDVYKRQGL